MNKKEAQAVARSYYRDRFARLIKDGNRGWVFGPSILTAGVGGCTLIIEKQSGYQFEIPSAFVGFCELAIEDFEERNGLFDWPEQGGVPSPNREKLLLRKIEQSRALASRGDTEHTRYLADLLTEIGRDIYLFKHDDVVQAENCLREAVAIQRTHVQLWSRTSQRTPLDVYVWFLHREKRTDEAKQLDAEFALLQSKAEQPKEHVREIQENSNSPPAAHAEDHNLIDQGAKLLEMAVDAADKNALGVLANSTSLYRSSSFKDALKFTLTASVQCMAECLTKLGRQSELSELAAIDEDQ